jgi:hypothetical protein
MTPERYLELVEQVGPDDAKRLALALKFCEAVRELGKHLESQPRSGDDSASDELRPDEPGTGDPHGFSP